MKLKKLCAALALASGTLFWGSAQAQISGDVIRIGFIADIAMRMMWFGGGRNRSNNNGGNIIFLVGDTTNTNDFLRGVLAFDLSDPTLTGATINSATLTLVVQSSDTGGSVNASVTLDLHELATAFDEASVSWTTPWTSDGGDFGSVLASASANASTVQPGDSLDFAGSALTDSVSGSVGGSLYLLTKLASEDDAARNIFRFGSIDGVSSFRSTLTIDYTAAVIPEPSAFALLGGLAALGFVAGRRRRAA